jgi:hypothetical protein
VTQKIDEKLSLLFLPLTRYIQRIVEGYWRFYIILTHCGGKISSPLQDSVVKNLKIVDVIPEYL